MQGDSTSARGKCLPLLLFFLIFFIVNSPFSSKAYAVPASPFLHTFQQPDGSTFRAVQWGDEASHGWESEDGFTILFDEELGRWTYATQDTDGSLKSSSRIVGRDAPPELPLHLRPGLTPPVKSSSTKSPSLVPQTIVVEGIGPAEIASFPVILINFSDTTHTVPPEGFAPILDSVSDYFDEVSYTTFFLFPDVSQDWYTASKTHDAYGDDVAGNDKDPQTLVREAVAAADAAGFDFSWYDMNGDCKVDLVMVVHQGPGQEESGNPVDLWSHYGTLKSPYTTASPCPSLEGRFMTVTDYILAPETLFHDGGVVTAGVIAHLVGRALGLPDLSDPDNSSKGVGRWSLMGEGMWNTLTRPGDRPSHLDAWSKYKLGWVAPIKVFGTRENETLFPVAITPDVYQLGKGSPARGGEYFLVENRQKIGFDEALPGSGLLIWHIDEGMVDNKDECYPKGPDCAVQHYKVSLVQADVRYDLEKNVNAGDDGDPYPGSTGNHSCTDVSSPNSRLYNGNPSYVAVNGISQEEDLTMVATLSYTSPQIPDLYIDSFNVPSPGAIDSSIPISVTVKNKGSGPSDRFRLGLYVSTDPAGYDSTFIDSCDFPSGLDGGTTSSPCILGWKPYPPLPPGSYYLVAFADDLLEVGEIYKDNNRTVNPITLTYSETITKPTVPTGPSTGTVGKFYAFTAGGSVSNKSHPLLYQFDWKGDGSDLSYFTPSSQSKTWSAPGIYHVRARAMCVNHYFVKSDWSDPLTVTITGPDLTAPGAPLNLTANPPSWTNLNSFGADWTNPDDPSGIGAAWYKIGSAPGSSADGTRISGSGIHSLSGLTLPGEGEHSLYVWLEDGAGNKDHGNRSEAKLRYDGTAPVSCTVTTNPSGLEVTVDGTNDATPAMFSWVPGASHTLSVSSPQSGGFGVRYVYASWNDGGAQTHSVMTPSTGTLYSVSFNTQYSLMTTTDPPEGGMVSPSGIDWYDSGQVVSLNATAHPGYSFCCWSGDISDGINPATITMEGPKNVTAHFTPIPDPDISISPSAYDFGKVPLGSSSLRIFTVSNHGEGPLHIGIVHLEGADGAQFKKKKDTCSLSSVPSLNECTVEVVFTPSSAGAKEGVIRISSNDPETPDVIITLMGKGVNLLIEPAEGTFGTEITITGPILGRVKGKVFLGSQSLKVLEWTATSVRCLLNKSLPEGDYAVAVESKIIAGFVEETGFTVKTLEIGSLNKDRGTPGTEVKISGNFFGTKKGKVYLESASTKPKSCKVLEWNGVGAEGERTIRFVVPKMSADTYALRVTNSVGSKIEEKAFTVE